MPNKDSAKGQKRKDTRRQEQQARERANREFARVSAVEPDGHRHKRPSKQARAIRRAIERAERERQTPAA